jgi:DNA-binding beta-propeller fold protein YncE
MRFAKLATCAAALAITPTCGALAGTPAYSVVDRIGAPDGGWDYLRVDPVHNRILIPRGTSVMAIDLKTKQATAGLVPGGRQHVALPMSGGAEMLVTNGANDSAIFADALTGKVVAVLPTAKGPDAATYDSKSGLVLVMGHSGGAVTLVDPRTHAVVGTVAIGGALEEAATDGMGRAFVNVEDKNEIAVIDISARKVIGRWPLGGCDGPTGLAYNANDKELIAACDGSTSIVRASDGKVLQTLATGKGADGAAYDAKRHIAFVPAGRDGTLAVIGFEKGVASVLQTVATQRGARTIALDERTARVYLPVARYGAPTTPGTRPLSIPGSFEILVVGPRSAG